MKFAKMKKEGYAMSEEFKDVLSLLKNGKYLVTLHAQRRMSERKISHADIRNCGTTGSAVLNEDKIKVTGLDCDGEALNVVCVNEDGVIIVTVF
jgi:hypothetical protein